MSEIKLKPCPFCGSKASVYKWRYSDDFCVACDSCGVMVDNNYMSEAEAAEAWNKRAEPEITLESAIDYLHDIGWMQEHDRIMAESTPVVHAHWEEWIGDIKCTSCGFICGDDYYLGSKNFCPNCGAKMDGEGCFDGGT